MPSRSLARRISLATPFLAALTAIAPARFARADEPATPPAPTAATATASASPSAAPASTTSSTAPSAPPSSLASPSAPLGAPASSADAVPDAASARPTPLVTYESRGLPWERMIDIGGDFALVARPATSDVKGRPSLIRYQAATGFALHIRWPLLTHLALEGYYVDVHMPVSIPRGALGIDDPVTSPPVETFVFGARVSPSMTWGPVTGRLTAGVGWGRFEFQRMTAVPPKGFSYSLRERGASFVEIPLGIGLSWEVVKRWLSIDLTATAAFVAGQHGDAFDEGQTADSEGKLHILNGLPVMDASLVQTIGFSLLL